MLPQIPLLDPDHVLRLQREIRISMRRMLDDLCDELEGPYRVAAGMRHLPVSYFRLVGKRLGLLAFSGWRVAGWLEALNDLVYFLDVETQLRRETDQAGFAEALFRECEEQFYEHGYRDDIFPLGRPLSTGLAGRIKALCDRLARQVVQESLFLLPELPCQWLGLQKRSQWNVQVDLGPDLEQAELAGRLPIGVAGRAVRLPAGMRKRLAKRRWHSMLVVRPAEIRLSMDGKEVVVAKYQGERLEWQHPLNPYLTLHLNRAGSEKSLSLGPTLVYGRGREPINVTPSPHRLADRVQQALGTIEQIWPVGASLLAHLTFRVIPLRARGVVSFSYRHRPGLSFINLFDRDELDLIDDLIHENSHHHLNVLLRKYALYGGDHNQEIFYSPWRRSLRPLRGILHAAFTFTMGAILFARLSSWAEGVGETAVRKAGLRARDVLRARFRCLEEIDSVQYSLRDLDYAAIDLGWLTPAGRSLVRSLGREIARIKRQIALHEATVLHSRYGGKLRRHRQELALAGRTYRDRQVRRRWESRRQ